MSRIANYPVALPSGVEVSFEGNKILVKGAKGQLERKIHHAVTIKQEESKLLFAPDLKQDNADAFAGTMRALVNNMVTGVSKGFEKRLELKGVGYRAQVQGQTLILSLGFSHPVNFAVPKGITIQAPTQTEIVVQGIDKQLVGQVAADIRSYRPPEPYKGKGIRYKGERIIMKEGKKK